MSAPTVNANQKSAPNGDAPSRKYRRRFAQYGLRLLLVIMALSACLFGLWSAGVQPYRQQERAVDVLTESGARLGSHDAEGHALTRWILGDEAFVEYHSLSVPGDVPASELDLLGRLLFLRELDLDHTPISDRQLTVVRRMTLLETLSVDHTETGDDGLVACGELPNMTTISMRYTRVTDSGLARLAAMPALETIYLTGTDVTDAGVADLARHRNLREVYVRYTDVTAAGAQTLTTALPDCTVHY